jgi:hypothetical protein
MFEAIVIGGTSKWPVGECIMRATVALVALALLGACTTVKEREVYGALRGGGFTEADARCLAARAARSLSIRQLRELQAAVDALDQPVREMAVGDAIDGLRANLDPQTVQLVARIGMECVRARIEEKAA